MFFGLFKPRVRKVYLPILEWLPDEVLIEIVRSAPKGNQAALCRTSKPFYALSLPILYQNVVLYLGEKTDIIDTFCLTVVGHPERADVIRSLRFKNVGYIRYTWCLKSLNYDLFFESLKRMNNLEHLSFDDDTTSPEDFSSRLASMTFPRLRHLAIYHPTSDSGRAQVARIFSLHRDLTHVALWSLCPDSDEPEYIKWDNTVVLQNLRHYEGHSTALLDACCTTRTLRAARIRAISWPTPRSIFATLQSRTSRDQNLPFTLSIDYMLKNDELQSMLVSLSGDMPQIRCLQMRSYEDKMHIVGPQVFSAFIRANPFMQTTVQTFAENLRRFGRIQYFALNYRAHYEYELGSVWNAKRCHKAVKMFAEACPTLRACCIGSRAWKKVIMDAPWVEYTRDAFEVDAGLSEFEDR
ncbi:hypothetical protein FB45DRAFT_875095 [Roridomyces roridus]|uniref:F-box domain-containing protein n=1 Tax=Roridomyces roridus TaxID=1738132 RepID=A0AAD7FDB2_9AGAR|nr:hypothetical protein FB45DRAFT_875095 [Roridomyces roridus]